MHYRNGREAKNGDKVVQLDFDQGQVTAVGILDRFHTATPHQCLSVRLPPCRRPGRIAREE